MTGWTGRRAAVLGVLLVLAAAGQASASTTVHPPPARSAAAAPDLPRVPPERVRALLVSLHWSPEAADEVAFGVPFLEDWGLWGHTGAVGQTYQAGADHPVYCVVAGPSAAVVEHEAHHAWDLTHGFAPERARADMVALAADPVVGWAAQRVLTEVRYPPTDDWHLNHRLTEVLRFDPRQLPDWWRERYVPYLGFHRVALPFANLRVGPFLR